MAAKFQLMRKGTKDAVSLMDVDNEMRAALGHPPDPKEWCLNWYNTVGLFIAVGKTWAEIRTDWPEKMAAINWLEKNFDADCWWGR